MEATNIIETISLIGIVLLLGIIGYELDLLRDKIAEKHTVKSEKKSTKTDKPKYS